MFKTGTVTSVNLLNRTARVKYDEQDNMVSGDLTIIQPFFTNQERTSSYTQLELENILPKKDDQVLIGFTGSKVGYIFGKV